MAGARPQRDDTRETMAEFVERRWREAQGRGQDAEAAARKAYGDAAREGRDLVLRTAGEVRRYGGKILNNRDARAIAAAGDVARTVGVAGGVVRGGVEAVEGLVDASKFVGRQVNPLGNRREQNAELKAVANSAVDAGKRGVRYVRKAVADPGIVVRDTHAKVDQMKIDLLPDATPVAPTVGDEVRRQLNIGMNQGELLFDAGSLFVGGVGVKGLRGVGAASKAGKVETYLAQGFPPAKAAYLAEPYPAEGMGHHFGPRRWELPEFYSESVFNVLKPAGITRGEMYKLHYEVDPKYHGGGFPADVGGGGWSGKKLGLRKYDLPGQIWYGSPAPLKAAVGGGVSAGGAMHDLSDHGDDR